MQSIDSCAKYKFDANKARYSAKWIIRIDMKMAVCNKMEDLIGIIFNITAQYNQ